MENIIFESVTRIAQAIRQKEISSFEVVSAYLAQIDRVNGALNAIITLDREGALAQAKKADEALAHGENWGALHGVPFTLKDSHSTAGMRTTSGFPPLKDYIPEHDGTVAKRLKDAGGILMGKTNVSELLFDIQSKNDIFGRSNNPWNHDLTSGGSSGGAAAAIASGMTPFDIGSDLGGSVRIPSAFCGIFGLKATERRISQYGHIPDLPGEPTALRIIATIGPMARFIEDLELLFGIIAGADLYDTDVPPVSIGEIQRPEVKSLRIAVIPSFADFPVSDEIVKAIKDLIPRLRPYCAHIDMADLPQLDYTRNQLSVPDNMSIEASMPDTDKSALTLDIFQKVLQRRDQFIIAWEQFFEDWDALICPVTMTTAFKHHETETPFILNGQSHPYWMMNAHCKVFNYTGHPALAMPLGLDSSGLPLSFQLVGKRWQEMRLLGIGKAISEITGQFTPPPL